jgi:hypothetical protein
VIFWYGYVDIVAEESTIVLISDRRVKFPIFSLVTFFVADFQSNGSSLDHNMTLYIYIHSPSSSLIYWYRQTAVATCTRIFVSCSFRMSASSFPVLGDESIMAPKSHGTTDAPVQSDLRSSQSHSFD